ncbi:MAG TPA: hypothetical protein VNY52_05355 [Solirubrobacteraceae bacterium]|jgi:hypothetical protein|nr:hypothetical protein [Solirubrobacteraceae bacterium]
MSGAREIQPAVWGRLSALTVTAVIVAGALCLLPVAATAKESPNSFEIEPGSFRIVPSTTQAAAHGDLTTSFEFAHTGSGPSLRTNNDNRTTIVNLPPGFVGNNTAVPTCTVAQLIGQSAVGEFSNPHCPVASQVGQLSFDVFVNPSGAAPEEVTIPVFNMEVTSFGVTAEFGFNVAGFLTQTLTVSVRPGDSGLTVTSPNISELGEAHHVSLTVWGLPASSEHDAQRGLECYSSFVPACQTNPGHTPSEAPHPLPAGIPVKPYLSNATSCEPHIDFIKADSWEHPTEWSEAQTEIGPLTECERVPFTPSVEVQPTTRSAESSSGLDVSLIVPQSWENPLSLSTANLKDSVVTLPVGYTANPSLASGLGVCTPAQFESETSSSAFGAGCPPESKIGEVDVETPVLVEKHLTGNIYIAKPYDNRPEFGTPEHPGGSLLGLYIVVKDPERGIIVKLAGRIDADPVTGQLVTTFDNNPQVPFSKFTLKLRQGANSPLVSPPTCGSYTAEADLTPWSAPLSPVPLTSSFRIENGIGGGPCPAGGVPPFKPALIAGTLNNSAGAYSPMDIHITRNDGEQELTRFSSILPPGLTANLSGIPFCPDANIQLARQKTGAQEETNPSCPKASEIGHTLVGAGVGGVLAYTPGKVYLAGPYNGAPFSVVSITSAKVGPFDLGTVVIRFALEINPETAVVTVDAKASDPIPHIIDGIVIHVRDIHVYVDRPQFMINPTSCDPENFAATVGGGGADPTNPADQQFVTTNDSFQLANCQNLQFKPSFKVTTSGKTSRANGASLSVKLSYPSAPQGTQANISRVKVELPHQLPSRLTTLQKGCTAAQFNTNPAGCPAASIVGHARAITPILPVPLEGPAYFVSHGGEAFPSLIVVLQGYGVTIDLVGSTFISKAGITSSTFKTVPDQPVTSFELTLPEGPYSALTALGNLCAATNTVTVKKVKVKVHGRRRTITRRVKQIESATLQMLTEFVAQNGAVIHQSTPVGVTGCAKAKAAKKTSKKHKGKKK